MRVTLRPGHDARRVGAGDGRIFGTFAASHGDTIVLLGDRARRIALARSDIKEMDVSLGRQGSVAGGAVAGLLVGALVGVVVSPAEEKKVPCLGDTGTCEAGWILLDPQMEGAVGGGLLGAVAGAAIASIWRRESWVAFDVGAFARLDVVPRPNRVSAAVTLRF